MQTYVKTTADALVTGDKFICVTTENKQIFGIRCNPYPESTAGNIWYVDFETGKIWRLLSDYEVLKVVDLADLCETAENIP